MGFFNSIGSSISTATTVANLFNESTDTKIEKNINKEQELTKRIAQAKQEIESFSLDPDESFLNDTTNKLKD